MTVTKKTAIGRLAAPFTVTDGVVTIDAATTSVAGLMTAADKTKLDGLTTTPCRYRGAGTTEPTSPLAGDIWIDTNGGSVVKIYDGTAWVST